jgi:hypothetical protein
MIRKSMPPGFDPMGGTRLSEQIVRKQNPERDDESKKKSSALAWSLR